MTFCNLVKERRYITSSLFQSRVEWRDKIQVTNQRSGTDMASSCYIIKVTSSKITRKAKTLAKNQGSYVLK